MSELRDFVGLFRWRRMALLWGAGTLLAIALATVAEVAFGEPIANVVGFVLLGSCVGCGSVLASLR